MAGARHKSLQTRAESSIKLLPTKLLYQSNATCLTAAVWKCSLHGESTLFANSNPMMMMWRRLEVKLQQCVWHPIATT